MTGESSALRAERLDVSVERRGAPPLRLVSGLDLDVEAGTSLAIVGRSGSGKTTLLSVLGLMRPPSGGGLWVGGQDVSRLSQSAAAGARNRLLGFVFQSYSLVEHLSVFDNVAMPLQYGERTTRAETRRRVLDQLAAVGLEAFGARHPRSLSGGEQQRVAIARSLVRSPRIVLADEPTGALDTSTATTVMQHLRDATTEAGSCLVVVTHDAELASTLDRRLDLTTAHSLQASHR
ncbi:ABC transporter ATP-binding protein [Sanguibacter sp. 25GB23B1]|uniref:ABC transporter ATP-binding protein n=1 Tax=unclassified Sanguibacter TaxID=2645534 RepID=UPI0032AF9DDB